MHGSAVRTKVNGHYRQGGHLSGVASFQNTSITTSPGSKYHVASIDVFSRCPKLEARYKNLEAEAKRDSELLIRVIDEKFKLQQQIEAWQVNTQCCPV